MLPHLLVLALSVTPAGTSATEAPRPEPVYVDFDMNVVRVSDHVGEVVLLNFWATWCGPCRSEMPVLVKLHDELGAQGLRVIGASANGRDDGTAVRRVMEQLDMRFDVWLWANAKDMARYELGPGIPATVLFDRSGRVRHRFQGVVHDRQLRPLVKALLAEPAPGDRREGSEAD